jgi:hypothetical protein
MTHTLHRLGNKENLNNDFVVFAMSAKGINEQGSAKALREFLEIAFEYNPINAGDMKTGNILVKTKEEIYDNIQDVSIVHAVFSEESKVAALLKHIKEADLGVSVVVSGLLDRVKEVGESVDIKQHTIECSGGIWGDTEKLPSQEVLEVTTMCGHGMVAANLVIQYAKQIKKNKITASEAAKKLAEPCVCGIFNIERAEKLLQAMADSESDNHKIKRGQTISAE